MKKSDFYIELLKFCDGICGEFSYSQLKDGLLKDAKEWEEKIVSTYLDSAHKNKWNQDVGKYSDYETIFWCTHHGSSPISNDSKYILSYNAKFNYIDYLELQLARNNAVKARNYSIIAIAIAVLSIIITVLIPLLIRQTIRIDDNQLKFIQESCYDKTS